MGSMQFAPHSRRHLGGMGLGGSQIQVWGSCQTARPGAIPASTIPTPIPIPAHLFDSDSDSDSSHLDYDSDSDSDSNTIFMNDSDSDFDSYSIPTAALLIL